MKAGVRNVVLLEAGTPGDGVSSGSNIPRDAFLRPDDCDEENVFSFAQKSGSAVLEAPAGTIKMMVNLFPSDTASFCRHHGEEGARRYLTLAHEGIIIQKRLAGDVLSNPLEDIRSLGSLYVCEEKDIDALRLEFEELQRLDCPGIEWWGQEQIYASAGGAHAGFSAGIYFPNDGIINSAQVNIFPDVESLPDVSNIIS